MKIMFFKKTNEKTEDEIFEDILNANENIIDEIITLVSKLDMSAKCAVAASILLDIDTECKNKNLDKNFINVVYDMVADNIQKENDKKTGLDKLNLN